MKNAVLAGIRLKGQEAIFDAMFQEAVSLCAACGLDVVHELVQNSSSINPQTGFGNGKLQELSKIVRDEKADVIVLLNCLSIAAERRIAEICDCEVIDRTALILNIFSHRASSRQAKVQVEMARLQYALPAIASEKKSEGHARGGGYRNRGAGQMRSKAIAAKYQARIQSLQRQLKEIERDSAAAEKRRSKSALGRVAIVGYTNAGKSSLLNAMLFCCKSSTKGVKEEDTLFATLQPAVRRMEYEGMQFLLYDTVGFVSDLPQQLLDAFHATLSAVLDADLLIHVIDASDPLFERKAQITKDTLNRIGADRIPALTVFSKIDLVKDQQNFDGLSVSAKTKQGISELFEAVIDHLYPVEERMIVRIPYDRMSLASDGRKTLRIKVLQRDELGERLLISGPAVRMKPFVRYREKEEE